MRKTSLSLFFFFFCTKRNSWSTHQTCLIQQARAEGHEQGIDRRPIAGGRSGGGHGSSGIDPTRKTRRGRSREIAGGEQRDQSEARCGRSWTSTVRDRGNEGGRSCFQSRPGATCGQLNPEDGEERRTGRPGKRSSDDGRSSLAARERRRRRPGAAAAAARRGAKPSALIPC
jgi:hypothetical protein